MEETLPEGRGSAFDVRDLIILALLLVLAIVLFWSLRFRLIHPLIDIGRDLYIPERLAHGELLYRDISYYYPPLAPYLLSIPARLTGWNLPVIASVGAIVAFFTGITLYVFCRIMISRVAAAAVATLFVCVNFTSGLAYGSNFVFPYSHGAIIGILFFLIGLTILVRGLAMRETSRHWWLALLFMMAAGWCKVELAAFGTVLMLIAIFLYWLRGTQKPAQIARHLLLAASLALGLLALASLAFSGSDPHWLTGQVLAPALFEGDNARLFYSRVTGSFMWRLNLRAALEGTMLLLVHGLVLFSFDRMQRTSSERRRLPIALLLLVIWLVTLLPLAGERFLFFRAWTILQPLLLLAAIGELVRRLMRHRPIPPEILELLLLLTASIAVTSRIYLHITPRWYGFWMILPLYLLIAHLMFRALPAFGAYSRRTSALWLPLLLLISVNSLADQARLMGEKIYPVRTERGDFFDHDPYRAQMLTNLLEYLDETGIEELVVMPEGLTINYFSRIPNPIWYHTFSPMEIGQPEIEEDAMRAIEEEQVRWILISNLAYTSWEGEGFGRGYAERLDRYLRSHYDLHRQWQSPTFRFYLLERRD